MKKKSKNKNHTASPFVPPFFQPFDLRVGDKVKVYGFSASGITNKFKVFRVTAIYDYIFAGVSIQGEVDTFPKGDYISGKIRKFNSRQFIN